MLLQELSSCADLYSGSLAFSVRNGQFRSVLGGDHEWTRTNTNSIAAKERIDRKAGPTRWKGRTQHHFGILFFYILLFHAPYYSLGFRELRSMALLNVTGGDRK